MDINTTWNNEDVEILEILNDIFNLQYVRKRYKNMVNNNTQ